MADSSRRAVITGIGILSPIGNTPAAFWQALLEGKSGIRAIKNFDASQLPCRIGGEVPDFSAKTLIDKSYRKALNAMSRPVQMGTIASQFAMQDAGLAKGSLPPERFGIEFASVMAATELDDFARSSKLSANCQPRVVDMGKWGNPGLKEIPPLWMLKYLPNMPACHVSILYDAQGPSNTLISGETAGILCFAEAARILRRGLADFMLIGGSDSKMNPMSLSRFNSFAHLSHSNDSPTTAVRPYDRNRDGTALGEGGAAFGLEDLEHAKKRGAKIFGEVISSTAGFDKGLTGTGFARVIRNALTAAGIQPSDLDHVNAHGCGSRELDAFEARGIAEAVGSDVPVYTALPAFGSLSAASAVIELAASVLALHHGQLPGTMNHANTDPACPIRVHTGAPRPVTKPYALKVAFTDLGQVAALVIKRWQE